MGQVTELKSSFSFSDPTLTKGRSQLLLALQGGNFSLFPGLEVSLCFCKCEGEDLAALALGMAGLSALQLRWSELVPKACPMGTSTLCKFLSSQRSLDALQQEAEPVP